jgi:dTDP-4-amino-4,6-dideoxygalactose transaminase
MVRTPPTDFKEVNPFLYYIRVPEGHRDTLRAFMKEHGVDTGIHWQPGHWFTLWKNCRAGILDVTDRVGREILSLPLHSGMALETVETVSEQVHRYFDQTGSLP